MSQVPDSQPRVLPALTPAYLGWRVGQGCVSEPLRASCGTSILGPETTGLLVSGPDPLKTEGSCLAGAHLCDRKGGR